MKVLIAGARGQVGRALTRLAPSAVETLLIDRAEADLTDESAASEVVAQFRPDVVINAAAYTAVDKAESETDAARQLNVDAVRWLAQAVRQLPSTRLVHISTDFVFDGLSSRPYTPNMRPSPLSVYGKTKLAGEEVVSSVLKERGVVVRTSWVYDGVAHNFLTTMLRLMREEKPLNVVADQVGTPTSADSIAAVLWGFCFDSRLSGVWHWSDAGVASWYDFAVAIGEEAWRLSIVTREPQVNPISTSQYPTAAVRPSYSVLDKRATIEALNVTPVHWRQNLRRVMGEIGSA